MRERGTKGGGERRSGGTKSRHTVLGTCRLRHKIGPVVTGMVMRLQHPHSIKGAVGRRPSPPGNFQSPGEEGLGHGARRVEQAVVEGTGNVAEHVDDRVPRLLGGVG